MKILYVTDLHGDQKKYNKTIDLAIHYKVDVILNGGDVLPNEAKQFSKTTYDVQKYFLLYFLKSYFEKLKNLDISFIGMLGNDDFSIWDNKFIDYSKKYKNIYTTLAGNCINIKGYDFIGMNYVCDYPFCLKDRCRLDYKEWNPPRTQGYPFKTTDQGNVTIVGWDQIIRKYATLKDELERLPNPKDYNKTIMVIHNPPSNLGLDVCSTGLKVGSKSVLEFICKKQPMLTLHGHIHESPRMSNIWKNSIDKTICIQPGQHWSNLIYVIIDINDNNVDSEIYSWRMK